MQGLLVSSLLQGQGAWKAAQVEPLPLPPHTSSHLATWRERMEVHMLWGLEK